jgi:AcrR family transcriptional regulator
VTTRSFLQVLVMPQDTFFNLPEDKRTLICQAAIGEFAAHSFAQASINRIVASSGIAKGSFYQYFENKNDLFLYLVQLVEEEKLKYLAPVVRNPERHDFFTLLRELSRLSVQFAVEHPQYAEFSKKLRASKGTSIHKEVTEHITSSGLEFFETLLENAITKGEIRADIDAKMLAYMITSMYDPFIEYCLEHCDPEYDGEMMETIDRFLDFLRHGIGEKHSAEPSK